jgi:hypothetical protein
MIQMRIGIGILGRIIVRIQWHLACQPPLAGFDFLGALGRTI